MGFIWHEAILVLSLTTIIFIFSPSQVPRLHYDDRETLGGGQITQGKQYVAIFGGFLSKKWKQKLFYTYIQDPHARGNTYDWYQLALWNLNQV